MKLKFVAADLDSITFMQRHAFDSAAIDERPSLDREILQDVIVSFALDYCVARLHTRVAEESDCIFLCAAERGTRTFDAVLAASQPSLLNHYPRRLRDFLHQANEETDRKSDEAEPDETRGQSAAESRVDRVEHRPANESAD